ncbi:homoserine kinase [Actinobacteria bacterium YIM 96077]|uniref:Homoserine kinase n=1 Tax=Phytoactinopolyspora halophila TaxID=1981511 RepID=A0A329QRV4_9ACTN|nr:homoserine kinase [Phytoactinopolyspora halophila]AYY14284.1 homoserine kinase [Actinobacteria bacterium YIM 96077]RAW14826.1 homoserine kinase [Phytoactinopolyspora halophila]
MTRAVRVRVPATAANIGPGFDALGLALGMYDVVDVAADTRTGAEPRSPLVRVSVAGNGADDVPRDENHLVARSVLSALAEFGKQPSMLDVHCHNVIPHGRGLGSSAAAIVAGVLAARELAGGEITDDAVLQLANRLEGHPDNVAPCLFGGLTIAWIDDAGMARATRRDVHPDVRPMVCVPSTSLATETARGLLPASVPHADAVHNAGRAALLVDALTDRPELLLDATEDRLHQAYREPAMPETLALVRTMRRHGLAAVVSGAGPSVLVLARDEDEGRVRELGAGWHVSTLTVEHAGATIETRADDMLGSRPADTS